jgi:hypothetical protein
MGTVLKFKGENQMADPPSPAPSNGWKFLKDPAMLIALFVMTQFFVLILLFGVGWIKMGDEAKEVILQTYVVAFTASWGFWLGSSAGSKAKDQKTGEK